ncbi:calcium-binding protein [Mesorhizobium sp. B2-4-19]|uniref:calcium-binding protein n=1 Tax=Mesorhizobium sp. B2-4-19 TaxID=2589930 RepID=UPI001125C35F|nr:calcium-binding protein [Mesorhizobium sp. B2-4-19]TPK63616.1 calcium-binding protein [Mesorhizobium sp. B2-4-19]
MGSSPFDQLPRPQVSEIYFDFAVAESQSFINQDGNLSTFDSVRAIVHEVVHQVYFTYDMTYLNEYGVRVPFGDDSGTYPSFDHHKMDIVGDTVQLENLIMSEMGSDDIRVSYPGAMSTSWFDVYGQELTGGHHIDTAILAFQADGVSVTNVFTNDLFISGDGTDDLVIGVSGPQYIFTGAGNDHLRDGSGVDILEGGAGDDSFYLYGDSDPDIVIVGEGNNVIIGGGVEDRIVLRGTNFGGGEDTQGIALLGGFRMGGWIEAPNP